MQKKEGPNVIFFFRKTCSLREDQLFAILTLELQTVKCFLVLPLEGLQKGTGLFLLASDWQKQWVCCCYCGGGRVKGSFWEVGERRKIRLLSSITHRRAKTYQRGLV